VLVSIENQLPKKLLLQFGHALAINGGSMTNGIEINNGQSIIFRATLFSTKMPATRLDKAPNIIPPMAKLRIRMASFTLIMIWFAYNALLNGSRSEA
jgi:hypothetical protein